MFSHLCWRVKDPLLSWFVFVGDYTLHEVVSYGGHHSVQQCIQPHLNLKSIHSNQGRTTTDTLSHLTHTLTRFIKLHIFPSLAEHANSFLCGFIIFIHLELEFGHTVKQLGQVASNLQDSNRLQWNLYSHYSVVVKLISMLLMYIHTVYCVLRIKVGVHVHTSTGIFPFERMSSRSEEEMK